MSQIDIHFSTLIAELEEAVRAGKNQYVLEALREQRWSKVPRPYLAPFAKLARRINQPGISLRIINPIIRAEKLLSEPASPQEKIVYAHSLTFFGFLDEASEILSTVNEKDEPEVLLYRSFAAFGKWNYRETHPWLKKYIKSIKISGYQRCIGQINLLAALIAEFDLEQAEHLARELRKFTKDSAYTLLYGNSLELSSQICLLNKNYEDSLEYLRDAKKVLSSAPGLYLELVKKWELICHLQLHKGSESSRQNLIQFRESALVKGHWEIVRDCELHLALASRDIHRLQYVVRGTPFPSYKRRAERLLGASIICKDKELLVLGEGSAHVSTRDPALEDLPTVSMLFWCLTQDFFKPISIGRLFTYLFPGEYFDPHTSAKRVHNVVYRFRHFINKKKWPLNIQSYHHDFFLRGDLKIDVYRRYCSLEERRMKRFHQKWGDKVFTSKNLSTVLGISQRLAQNLIKQTVISGKVLSQGKGRSQNYRFSNRKAS